MLWLTLLCLGHAATKPAKPTPTRFWLDTYIFFENNTVFLKSAVDGNSGTVLVGEARHAGEDGHKHLGDFDVYWTSSDRGYKAHELGASAGHRINCLPGVGGSIAPKSYMVLVARHVYGPQAFAIIPPTYRLPEDQADLKAFLRTKEGAVADWVLKSELHRGQGVRLARGKEVLQYKQYSKGLAKPYVAAQRLVSPQFMLQGGRKIKLRISLLVMGLLPTPRAFVFSDGGIVLTHAALWGDGRAPGDTTAHGGLPVVNTHQPGGEADVLTLHELRARVDAATGSPDAYDALWDTLTRQLAALVGMSAPLTKYYRDKLPGAAGGFELFGVDVLVDAALQPWIIEVNNDPQFPSNPAADRPARYALKKDTFDGIVGMLRVWHVARQSAAGDGRSSSDVEEELWAAGSRWVAQEEQVARAHRYVPLGGLVAQALGCQARSAATQKHGFVELEPDCELLRPGTWEAAAQAGRGRADFRTCELRPLEALLGSIATCAVG